MIIECKLTVNIENENNSLAQAMKDLQGLAAKKQITIPTTLTDNGGDAYDKLMKKTGKDFDKAYINLMLKNHEADIKVFRKESADGKDPDLKIFATSTPPVVQKHIDSAMVITGKNQ